MANQSHKKRRTAALAFAAILLCSSVGMADGPILFETHVFPIFKVRCAGCHFPGAEKLERNELVLSTVADILLGGKSGDAVIPGNAEDSALVEMIEYRADHEMPPSKKFDKLPPDEIAVIRQWIDGGALSREPISLNSETTKSGDEPVTTVENFDKAPVGAIAFSPDGKLLARGRLGVVEVLTRQEKTDAYFLDGVLRGHAEMVRGLAFSPDGSLLAAGGGKPGRSGEIKVWRVEDRTLLHTLAGHRDNVQNLAFSPDGKRLASCSYDKTVRVWDVVSGRELYALKDHVDAVYSLAYSPDGKLLASGAGDRTVKIWDAQTGERLLTLSDSTDAVHAVVFSPDSRRIAAGSTDKMIRIWDVAKSGRNFSQTGLTSGVLIHSKFAHNGTVLHLLYSPDGSRLYSASNDLVIKAWDTESMMELFALDGQSDWVMAFALSADGRRLAAGRYDATTTVYDAVTGEVVWGRAPTVLASQDREADEGTGRKKITTLEVGNVLINATIPPSIASVSPVRWQRGAEFEMTLEGKNLEEARPFFSDEKIGVELLENEALPIPEVVYDSKSSAAQIFDFARPYRLKLRISIPADISLGRKEMFIATPGGLTNGRGFTVLARADVDEEEPDDASSDVQELPFPSTVAGDMEGEGGVDEYRFHVDAGTEMVFVLSDASFKGRLALLDESGDEVASSETFRGGRTSPRLGYRSKDSGAYTLRVTNESFGTGGGYRLHAGEFPFVRWTDRLGVEAGSLQYVAVKGFNLGGPGPLEVHGPEDPSYGKTVDIPLPSYEGNPIRNPRLAVGKYAESLEQEPNDEAPEVVTVAMPITINGLIDDGGDRDHYRFSARQGERIIVEVMAARLGSDLDSVVEILDSDGRPIQRATVRCVAQTVTTLSERDSRTSGLRIENWSDLKVNDYLMVGSEILKVSKLPDYADEDLSCRAYWNGQRQTYLGTTPEHHAVNTAVYKVEIHPSESTFPPNGMPVFPLYWRNDDGYYEGKTRGDSYLAFDVPEDGEYVVRIGDVTGRGGESYGYRLTLRKPEPDFDVAMGPYRVNVHAGSRVPIDVRVKRRDDFSGPVKVRVHGLPEGLDIAPDTILEGHDGVRLALVAALGAASTDWGSRFKITAEGDIDGKHVVRETWLGPVTVVHRQPDVVVHTDRDMVALEADGVASLSVTLDRFNGFTSRVPVDVKNLPRGVRVLDTGLNGILVREGEFTRSMELYAEPWVAPVTRTIYVEARIESRSPGRMLFLSKPIVLHIGPGNSLQTTLAANAPDLFQSFVEALR